MPLTDEDRKIVTFTINCTMSNRWARQFLGMLRTMQRLGSWGSSRNVTFYADGDGDFRPKFEFIMGGDLETFEGGLESGTEIKGGDYFFDAG